MPSNDDVAHPCRTGTAIVLGQRSSCIFAQPLQKIVAAGDFSRVFLLYFKSLTHIAAESAKIEYDDFSNLNSNAQEIVQIYDLAARANAPSITNATHNMV